MLFVVPQGSDDDWYWIYSTILPHNNSTTKVVTNDHMRDHVVDAFLSSSLNKTLLDEQQSATVRNLRHQYKPSLTTARAYLRWRASTVVYYEFQSQLGNYSTVNVSLDSSLLSPKESDSVARLSLSDNATTSEIFAFLAQNNLLERTVELFGPGMVAYLFALDYLYISFNLSHCE